MNVKTPSEITQDVERTAIPPFSAPTWLHGQTLNIINGDCRDALQTLDAASVQCVVTSPPYWGLRDYGHENQIGQEDTPDEYVAAIVGVMREVRRVLKDDGTVWLNIGDSYARNGGTGGCGPNASVGSTKAGVQNRNCKVPDGLKSKDLCLVPARLSLALQADGWYIRNDIIWHKPNPMPESITDRCTRSHEYIFLLTKAERYYYDAAAIREPAAYGEEHANKATSWGTNRKHPNKSNVEKYAFVGENKTCHVNRDGVYERNKRDVWMVATQPCKEAHFATFPAELITPCILAGTKPGDVVLDPFGGSGTTGKVALELGRRAVLVELNPEYSKLCEQRCTTTPGLPLAV